MGLQKDLGYEAPQPNAVQRFLHRMGFSPTLAPLLGRGLTSADRFLHRASAGRITVTGRVGAFPTVMLATTGARTGRPRTVPVSAIPYRDDLALIASYMGSGKVPGWAHNLRSNPTATIMLQDRTRTVVAAEAGDEELEEIFAAAVRLYAPYRSYRERARHKIPVFVLTGTGPEEAT